MTPSYRFRLRAAIVLLVVATALLSVAGNGRASETDPSRHAASHDADAVAARIRELEAQTQRDPDALQAVADEAAALAAALPPDSPSWRRLQSDRLYALLLAGRSQAALDAYLAFETTATPPPDYVIPELASVLAANGRTAEALVLFERMSAADPASPDAAIRIAYLLSDAGRGGDARRPLLDWLAGTDGDPGIPAERRLAARLALARIERWNERLDQAERTLQAAPAEARRDPAWRTEAAALARARGRPRAALAAVDGVADAEARAISARAWLDLGRPDRARTAGAGVAGLDTAIAAALAAQSGTRGTLALGYSNARSAAVGSPNGNDALSASARLDTPWLGGGWRLGATAALHRAEFRGVRPEARYGGLRVVRHGTGGESLLEIGRSEDAFLPGSYALARTDHWLGDHWRLAARVAANDPEGSLQARTSGIGSDSADIAATWRPGERWRADVGYGHVRFDDGNRRNWISLSTEHRIRSRPGALTSVFAAAYSSRSSLADAAYFNPRRDASLELGLVHGFRGYGDSWQTLRPSLGYYDQAGFGGALIPRLGYGLRFPLAAGRWWSADVAASRPVYDGTRETQWSLALAYAWGRP